MKDFVTAEERLRGLLPSRMGQTFNWRRMTFWYRARKARRLMTLTSGEYDEKNSTYK